MPKTKTKTKTKENSNSNNDCRNKNNVELWVVSLLFWAGSAFACNTWAHKGQATLFEGPVGRRLAHKLKWECKCIVGLRQHTYNTSNNSNKQHQQTTPTCALSCPGTHDSIQIAWAQGTRDTGTGYGIQGYFWYEIHCVDSRARFSAQNTKTNYAKCICSCLQFELLHIKWLKTFAPKNSKRYSIVTQSINVSYTWTQQQQSPTTISHKLLEIITPAAIQRYSSSFLVEFYGQWV